MPKGYRKGGQYKRHPDQMVRSTGFDIDLTKIFETKGDPTDAYDYLMNNKSKNDEPELSLMKAVFFDALKVINKNYDSKKKSRKEELRLALDWIESTDDEPLFSFENVCSLININASNVRERIFIELEKKRIRREAA
jgi:hypothetical protein